MPLLHLAVWEMLAVPEMVVLSSWMRKAAARSTYVARRSYHHQQQVAAAQASTSQMTDYKACFLPPLLQHSREAPWRSSWLKQRVGVARQRARAESFHYAVYETARRHKNIVHGTWSCRAQDNAASCAALTHARATAVRACAHHAACVLQRYCKALTNEKQAPNPRARS